MSEQRVEVSPLQQFEHQFANMKRQETTEGPYTSVRVTPDNPRGNTVVYGLGWTAQVRNCKPFFKEFFRRDKDVLSIQYPSYEPSPVPEGSIYNPFALRNADAMVDAIDKEGLKKVDLVGDSEGSSVILTVANRLKEQGKVKVGNIVLVSPSGFGKPSFKELVGGIAKMLGQEAVRYKRLPSSRFLINGMMNPVAFKTHPLRTIQEGGDVSNARMIELIKNLGDYADSISILHSNDDPVVPIERVNPDIQYALQEKTRAHEVELRNQVKTGEISPEQAEERRKDQRNNDILIASADRAGHIYFEYPPSVSIPIVSDILDFKETGIINPKLPNISEDPAWNQEKTKNEIRQRVAGKIRRVIPRIFPLSGSK